MTQAVYPVSEQWTGSNEHVPSVLRDRRQRVQNPGQVQVPTTWVALAQQVQFGQTASDRIEAARLLARLVVAGAIWFK